MPSTSSAILFVLALQYSCQHVSARLVSDSNIVDLDHVSAQLTAYVRKQYQKGTEETTKRIMNTMADSAVNILRRFRHQDIPESFDDSSSGSPYERKRNKLRKIKAELFRVYQDSGKAYFSPLRVSQDWDARWESGDINYACEGGWEPGYCHSTRYETEAAVGDTQDVLHLLQHRCSHYRTKYYLMDNRTNELLNDSAPVEFPGFDTFMTAVCPDGVGPTPSMKMSELGGHFKNVNEELNKAHQQMKSEQTQEIANLNLTSVCSPHTGGTCVFSDCKTGSHANCSFGRCVCHGGCQVKGYCRTTEEITTFYASGSISRQDLSVGAGYASTIVDELASGATDMLNDLRSNPMVLNALQQLVSGVEEKVCMNVNFMPSDSIGALKEQMFQYITPQVGSAVAFVEEYLTQGMEFMFTPIRLLPFIGDALSPLLSSIVKWAQEYSSNRLKTFVMQSLQQVFATFINHLPQPLPSIINMTDQVSKQIKATFNCQEFENTASALELDDATMSAISNALEVGTDYY